MLFYQLIVIRTESQKLVKQNFISFRGRVEDMVEVSPEVLK